MSARVSVVRLLGAVGTAVKELGSVPSGHLYAMLMPYLDFETYENIIATLQRAGLIRVSNHVIEWIGDTEVVAK